MPFHSPEQIQEYFYTSTVSQPNTSNAALIAAPGTGSSLYITNLGLAGSVNTNQITIVEDPSGTPRALVDRFLPVGFSPWSFQLGTPIVVGENLGVGFTVILTSTISIGGYIA